MTLHESEAEIPLMVDRIVEQFHPRRVVLLGSRARGTATTDSNVDLLIVLDRVADKRGVAIENSPRTIRSASLQGHHRDDAR